MNKFNVDIDMLRKKEDDFARYSNEMKELSKTVNLCSMKLGFMGPSAYRVKNDLKKTYERVLDEAARMDSFKDAVIRISELYKSIEREISGNADVGDACEVLNNSSDKVDKRSGWTKLWDKIFHRKVDTKYTATSSEQERAADAEFQRQIEHLKWDERYTQEYWARASVAERKKILEDYMHDVANILGVNVNDRIHFTNTKQNADGSINMGSYSPGGKTVSINQYILENRGAASYTLMTTIVHELRHAYQHGAIAHPSKYQVSAETIESWKESFRTYDEMQSKGFDSYRNIVVERDARHFAGQD